jgi:CubicO group peptidase (beta-lactamase class C family)
VSTELNDEVQALLQRQVDEGSQIGVQVCAYRHGRRIVHAWAGRMGPHDVRPVTPDSLFCSFSATKGVAALALHLLVDRGQIDLDAPVASYWPAFAAEGKGELTVAQAVSHQGGLHAMPAGAFDPRSLTDWDAALARVAAAKPAWEHDGTAGYHAVTYGWIVGGIVAGATGRHLQEVIRTEIAEPLGVDGELFVGIPVRPDVLARLTTLELVAAGDGLPIPDDAPFYEAMPKDMWPYFNDVAVRAACVPGGNGHFTAKGLARMYGALANGGELDGVRLCGPERVAAMAEKVVDGVDRVLMVPSRKAVGFMLGGLGPHPDGRMVAGLMGPSETVFGHPGAGGSIGFADPGSGLGVAVTINKMQYPLPGEGPGQEICDLIRAGADR